MLTYTAFENFKILGQGGLENVALTVKKRLRQAPDVQVLIFSDATGKQMDLDVSGSDKEVLDRLKVYLAAESPRPEGPGRPKLGVISREVSLLPAHWEWLSTQTGGASGTIRRLIDEKRKAPLSEKDQVKGAQETVYRFLSAIAGDLPNFEEAIRYLYRRDRKKFKALVGEWPAELVKHTMDLAKPIFD